MYTHRRHRMTAVTTIVITLLSLSGCQSSPPRDDDIPVAQTTPSATNDRSADQTRTRTEGAAVGAVLGGLLGYALGGESVACRKTFC